MSATFLKLLILRCLRLIYVSTAGGEMSPSTATMS